MSLDDEYSAGPNDDWMPVRSSDGVVIAPLPNDFARSREAHASNRDVEVSNGQ